jgi:acyl-CoA reductase-like NAD-dependent aldehyde dehydrogenase
MSAIDWVERAASTPLSVQNLVGGKRRDPSGNERIDKFSPRDGQPLVSFAGSSAADVDEAVTNARASFADRRWSERSLTERKLVLLRLADLIDANAEELALLDCLDVGKPIAGALAFDVHYAASLIRYAAEAIDKLHAPVFAADRFSLSYELLRPLGVVAAIVGWNFPLVLAASKVGPALAAGNSLVLKPSEISSLSAARLAELALEAGVPDGVFNVVHGGGATGAPLASHRHVDLLTFTGSSATGGKLMVAAGQSNMKRLILECGGKAANIVFEDCPDLDAAAAGIVERAFWNQGQVCTASSRLIVERTIRSALLERIIAKMDDVRPGDPLDPTSGFGALVSAAHRDKILQYRESGLAAGGELLFGPEHSDPVEGGFYTSPCIIRSPSADSAIAQEEIFGPLLTVLEFDDEAEAIRLANGTIYGLSAIAWTSNLGRAQRLAYGLDSGWITINGSASPRGGPGTGVMSVGGHKQSGLGSEGGLEGLGHYLSRSAVQFFG